MKKTVNLIAFYNTKITDGFWKSRTELNRKVTAKAVYDRFYETGRIEAFKFNWRDGDEKQPHFFWDSDVAKWIEGVAYLTRESSEPSLEALADEIIDDIVENQGEDGYFNIYFTVVEPQKRFADRDKHELYCAGHLFEAAVAYYEATGKRKLLDAMCKYADYIYDRFMIKQDTAFVTSGHEEIELALFRLYECTGEKRYFDLAEFFINQRGNNTKDPTLAPTATHEYNQSHLPVRRQREAVGHAVRAAYLYASMAELAGYTDDEELFEACDALFDNITKKRMYITGGIGSSSSGEAFTVDYDLPNILAYSESCAAIGLVFFANKMLAMKPDSKYSDTVERVLYNGFLSSTSLSGDSFFYENPLATLPYLATKDYISEYRRIKYPLHQRSRVFKTSCCPCNIVRFTPTVSGMVWGDDGENVFVHQYMNSETEILRGNKTVKLYMNTKYPVEGKVEIKAVGADIKLAVRIPYWHKGYKGTTKDGYAYLSLADGECAEFNFDMTPRFVESRCESHFTAGKAAVMRGPVVYCVESVDNGEFISNIRLDSRGIIDVCDAEEFGIPTLLCDGYRRTLPDDAPLYSNGLSSYKPVKVKLIPYFGFANRGVSEMAVWQNIVF